MEFDSKEFLKNLGRSLGVDIEYEIVEGPLENDLPRQVFHFSHRTCVFLHYSTNGEAYIPTMRDNVEAMYAVMFLKKYIDMGDHKRVRLCGMGDVYDQYSLYVQPYTPNDNDTGMDDLYTAFKGMGLNSDMNDLEDVFKEITM